MNYLSLISGTFALEIAAASRPKKRFTWSREARVQATPGTPVATARTHAQTTTLPPLAAQEL